MTDIVEILKENGRLVAQMEELKARLRKPLHSFDTTRSDALTKEERHAITMAILPQLIDDATYNLPLLLARYEAAVVEAEEKAVPLADDGNILKELRPGQVFEYPGNGNVEFIGLDRYMGETTCHLKHVTYAGSPDRYVYPESIIALGYTIIAT